MLKPKPKEAVAKHERADVVPIRGPADFMSRFEDQMERRFEDFMRAPFSSFRHMERLFRDPMLVKIPVLDMYQDKEAVTVKVELPGMSKENVEVTVDDQTLVLKGEKKMEQERKDQHYTHMERSYGAFTRTMELPCAVKADAVKATFKDGVLEVRLPKTEEAKSKTITVKVD